MPSHPVAHPPVEVASHTSAPRAPATSLGPGWSWRPWSWLALTALLVALRVPTFQIWGDVRYTLGVERVTARTGWPSSEVWTHRPMLNRMLMAGLDRLTADPFRELQLLAWSALAAGAVVWLLHRQLRRWLGWIESAALGAAVLVALIWAPSVTILQPEWYAVLTAVAAVGVAGLPQSRHRLGEAGIALGAASLLVATVLMKWTTVSTAVTAAAVVLALCWRLRSRLALVAAASIVLLPVVLGLQILLIPHEGLWLKELPQLNRDPTSMVWCPVWPAPTDSCGLQKVLMNEVITSPALVILPAALVLLALTTVGPMRVAALVLPVVAFAGTLATTVAQAQWFPYHLAIAPVVAAGWLAWAVARWARRVPSRVPPLALPALLAMAGSSWLLMQPLAVRRSADPLWFGQTPANLALGSAAGLAALAVILALRGIRRLARTPTPASAGRSATVLAGLMAVLAVTATMVNPVLPTTAYSFNFRADYKTPSVERDKADTLAALGTRIRATIGADTPVVYLSPGERSYWVGNPTYCRYAAATYLQRTRYVPTAHLVGFAENLACLADGRATYVVIENGWLKLAQVDPVVQQRLGEFFDCSEPAYADGLATVCPRRPGR